jgi:O-Antigen ligase
LTERFARTALVVLIAGLALHNVAMAQLWDLGVRGNALDVVAAWKEVLLLLALVLLSWKVRRLPAIAMADLLALAYTAIVLAYALLPQDWLDGGATDRGILLAVRHDLLPVGAYAFGRLLSALRGRPVGIGVLVALTAAAVSLIGLLDVFIVSLQSWRDSGVPGWYREQLSLDYEGLSGLPENWVYNTGDEDNPIRRLVSTFLSPLASAYVLVVALVYLVSRGIKWWTVPLGLLLFVALLYTHTRSAVAALAVGLVLLAAAERKRLPVIIAAAVLVLAAGFFLAYSAIGPSTTYTPEEIEFLRENAQQEPGTSADPFSTSESSVSSHWRNLRDGVETVLEHPEGYGLGNAGVVAKRTGVEIKAGESTYTELGVDAGLAGALAFVLWNLVLLAGLWRRSAWLAAALAAVLFLGLQTDVIGVPWIAVILWAAAGLAVSPRESGDPKEPMDG